jgi:hypothetical protein
MIFDGQTLGMNSKDITDNLAHLQSRIDLAQGTLDALAPLIIEAAVRARHPGLTGERLKIELDRTFASYLEAQKNRTVKYSEFPFFPDEQSPDTNLPSS